MSIFNNMTIQAARQEQDRLFQQANQAQQRSSSTAYPAWTAQDEQQGLTESQRRATDPAYLRQQQQTDKFFANDGIGSQDIQNHPGFQIFKAIHSLFQLIHGPEQGTQNFIKFFKNAFGMK